MKCEIGRVTGVERNTENCEGDIVGEAVRSTLQPSGVPLCAKHFGGFERAAQANIAYYTERGDAAKAEWTRRERNVRRYESPLPRTPPVFIAPHP